jgi:uncharacterized membrane protein YbhN (UPF0104 family)
VSGRRVLASAVAWLAAGLVVAAVATAVTDPHPVQNVVGGVLLGLAGGVGSSLLHSGKPPRSGQEGR